MKLVPADMTVVINRRGRSVSVAERLGQVDIVNDDRRPERVQ